MTVNDRTGETAKTGGKQAGPDFFCIGAQKAGTGWLYEQLRDHPDFWMPPIKELHYFDRFPAPGEQLPERTLPLARKPEERFSIGRTRARDDRDRLFLEEMQRLYRRPELDLQGYAQLFSAKGKLISGDITPGYSALPEPAVARIAADFPRAKIIFLARDPVERAWSQLSMYARRNLIEQFDLNDVAAVSRHLARAEVAARSYPSRIAARWRRYVDAEQLRIFFFDDLVRDPVGLRGAIVAFLGADPAKPSGRLPADHDTKAGKEKLPLTGAMRSHLARFFEAELKACATELGGAAIEWPGRYGY